MSIRKNNKQVAGNYININMEVFNELIDNSLKEVTSTGDQYKQDIITLGDQKKEEITSESNTQLSLINSTAESHIQTMDDKIAEVTRIGDEKIENINTTSTSKIEEMNQIAESIKTLANVVGASTVGVERFWRGNTPPALYLLENGQLVSREEYPELYQWAVDNNLIIEDSDWTEGKKYGFYSYGDGSTTFRLPNMKSYYLVGYDEEHHTGLGVYQEDGMPKLSGTMSLTGTNDSNLYSSSSATGVFKVNKKTEDSYPITGSTTLTPNLVSNIEFDSSVQIKASDRIEPKSIPVNFIVCYKNVWDTI